jgi:hypothetical protein
MRILIALVLVAACAKDPLREDMKMFCRAVDIVTFDKHLPKTGPGHVSFMQLGPWIAERAKTPELQALLATVKDGRTTIVDLEAGAEELVKKANLEGCPTLYWMKHPME